LILLYPDDGDCLVLRNFGIVSWCFCNDDGSISVCRNSTEFIYETTRCYVPDNGTLQLTLTTLITLFHSGTLKVVRHWAS